jgi:hypothetical protein
MSQVINSLAVLAKAFEEEGDVVDGLSKVARRYESWLLSII